MSTLRKQSLVFLVAVVLLLTWAAPPALAEEKQYQYVAGEDRKATAMMVDLVFYRPVGIGLTAVGAAFFIVSLPFTLLGGNTDEAAEKLVREPFKFTFARPLGAGIF